VISGKHSLGTLRKPSSLKLAGSATPVTSRSACEFGDTLGGVLISPMNL
jgi:hypothetical protein